jgi:hypothetical protein
MPTSSPNPAPVPKWEEFLALQKRVEALEKLPRQRIKVGIAHLSGNNTTIWARIPMDWEALQVFTYPLCEVEIHPDFMQLTIHGGGPTDVAWTAYG